MGLDMYIRKRTYQYRRADGTLTFDGDALTFNMFGVSNGVYIEEGVAYWRKANAIHGWFTNNTNYDENNCTATVSLEELKKLSEVCHKVIDNAIVGSLAVPYDKDACENFRITKKYIEETWDKNGIDYKIRFIKCKKEYVERNLPTTDGFFFGTLDYGSNYVYNLMKTIKMIDEILNTDVKEYPEFIYEASY